MTGEQRVRTALDAMAEGDLDAFLDCLHDDLALKFPYAGEGTPTDKQGLAGLLRYLVKVFPTRSFELDTVHRLADSDGLIIEYHSEFRTGIDGIDYSNRYVGIFEFRDGLISRWVEYANPIPFNEVVAAIAQRRQ